jgi:hypothetical protein
MKLTPLLLLLLLSAPAQANSIAGQWTYRADVFDGECTQKGETHETIVTIQQTDNQFTAQGGLTCQGRCMEADKQRAIGSGTITGDRIQSQDAKNILRWSGKLSADGSAIQGKATCQMGGGTGKGEFPFTMQRQNTKTQNTTVPPANSNYLRPDFDDNESTPANPTQPTSVQPQPSESTTAPSHITGEWVVFLGTPLSNYGSADRITQRGPDFQLISGISGEKFYGKISDDRIETNIPRTSPGILSPDRNIIRFSDMAMVRLGSPTCGTIATCQLP